MKQGRILWKVGEALPQPLRLESPGWLQSIVVPRPLAWLSVDDERVALLNGYTAACYTPPTLLFAGSSLPRKTLARLKETGKCTVSLATARDPPSSLSMASTVHSISGERSSFTFQELKLSPIKKREDYPCAVEGSPVHLYCSLSEEHSLIGHDGDGMVLLIGESVLVDGSVLSDPTDSMKSRAISSKIDAGLIQPIVTVGPDQFRRVHEIRSLPRPKQQPDGTWVSSDFQTVVPVGTKHETHPALMTWNYQVDGHACALGFNPTLAFIMPRPIGWISTYSSSSRVPHLAPYSFFIDVAHGFEKPMVAFSAYRPQDGTSKKDAHKDTEEMGCFCFNLCTEDMAVAVNLSAAELKRDESEFALTGLAFEQANFVDAPYVRDAPVHLECVYERTVPIGNFSIVIGRIQALSMDNDIIAADGRVDTSLLRLIGRLGYTDEYGIIS